MKLCLLVDNSSVHNQKWTQALSVQKDIELHMISFDGGHQFANVNYHLLKRFTHTKLDYFLNVSLVKKKIKFINPDVLHSHYATSYGYLGARSGFHPYILTGWGADIFDSPKNFFMKRILRYALSKADAITVLSKITSKEISKYTNKPIHIIPFGVDVSMFFSSQKNKDSIIRIGTIRTLSEKYGLEYLILAFAQLVTKYNNIRLEIVGDGEQKQYLKSLAEKLNVSNEVTFHGFVSQTTNFEKYIGLLRNFDIFTILSILDSETFGVAAVEASACGIPVIATSVGGLPEVVVHEKTGFIVSPKSVTETILALEKLILDKNLRTTYGNNGREKVENEFNWDKNVQQMIEIYQRLLIKK